MIERMSYVRPALVAIAVTTAAFVACSSDDPTPGVPGSGGGGSGAAGGSGGTGGTGAGGDTGGAGGSNGGAGGGGEGGTGGSCLNELPNLTEAPDTLSLTGLYANIDDKTIGNDIHEFQPQFPLWSDGLVKTRWIYKGECDPIDTSDMDNWSFPVGTRVWKEFVYEGTRVETRLLHRFGPGTSDFIYATYIWNEDETEAALQLNGQAIELTEDFTHNVPDVATCHRCHGPHPSKGGLPSRVLGFGAIQLSHDLPGLTIESISNDGWLSDPAPDGFIVPGSELDRAALGYMHANCSNCHNNTIDGLIFPSPKLKMRLKVDDVTLEDTDVCGKDGDGNMNSVVGVATQNFADPACNMRIEAGNSANSCALFRMTVRGDNKEMPPIGTAIIDDVGATTLETWIDQLNPKCAPDGSGGAGGGS